MRLPLDGRTVGFLFAIVFAIVNRTRIIVDGMMMKPAFQRGTPTAVGP